MQFIGTGAGEGVPNPFCKCSICENARKVGGKEIRTRSSFRVSESIVIDVGADFFGQCAFYGIDFAGVRHILYTHTHDDHFNYTAFWERSVRSGDKSEPPINVYFVGDAYNVLDKFYMISPMTAGRESYTKPEEIVFHKLEFFTEYEIDRHKITAFPGRHGTGIEKNAANYLIVTPEGKKLYYALDSGWFLDETFAALENRRLDYFIGECTYNRPGEPASKTAPHMNLGLFLENCEKLYSLGTITDKTEVYLTHMGSKGITHAELCEYLETLKLPYRLIAAYDTLKIN